jgi:protein TonB
MPKPLVSNDPNPKDVSFSHFGVLDDGKRSKGAAVTSIIINSCIILFLVLIGMIVKTNPELAAKISPLYLPPKVQPKPPAPKPPPPPPPKPLPEVPKLKIEPPKLNMPKPVPLPPVIKPMPEMPKPVVMNAPAPKHVIAVAAPKAVNLAAPAHAASIANNDAHPSAVRLGNPEIRALNGRPVAQPVNLGGGMHGMPASNTGSGPRAHAVNFGNGSPSGTSTRAGAVVPVSGFRHVVPGGTGHGLNGPQQVRLGEGPREPRIAQPVVHTATLAKPPVVTYEPKPEFTPDATAAHVQGEITVRVVFHANGTISVVRVVHGLGHGLDQEAEKVADGIRFKPALDSDGRPTDFETNIIIRFVSNY